jgi:uncharacterized membrane protein YdjX (TVP38/TMEM64 family)
VIVSEDLEMNLRMIRWTGKTVVFAALAVAAGVAFVAANHPAFPVFDEAWVRATVRDLGVFGPVALIGLMVLAIVVSPIPSGPIAVAAGALYGTNGGMVVSVLGAQIGALIAFSAARYLGYDAVRRSENPIMKFIAVPRSQRALMWVVFGSRLIPFISFDAISYAAGITNLSFWRFTIATALGVVPICWILSAMGAGMATGGTDWMLVVTIGGAITLVPATLALLRSWRRG